MMAAIAIPAFAPALKLEPFPEPPPDPGSDFGEDDAIHATVLLAFKEEK
jgi:hypothetical protein